MTHEHENEARMRVFCPLEQEVVDVREECEVCRFWEGDECVVGRGRPLRGSRRPRARISRPGSRRQGPGLRVPLVWEAWPEEASMGKQPRTDLGSDEYEQAMSLDEELYPVPQAEAVDWDHEPLEEDIPDWLEGGREALPTDAMGDEALGPAELMDEPWGPSVSAAAGIPEPPEPDWPEVQPLPDLSPEIPMERPLPPTPGFGMPDDGPEGAGELPGGGPPQAPM